MSRLVVLSLLALCSTLPFGALAGCTPGASEGDAEAGAEAEEGWRVHVAEPEADEEHPGSVLLTRRAEGGEAAPHRPRLVLGCEEGVTQAYVEWGTPLGAAEVPVTYRLDDGALQAARWQVSIDGEAAGRWHDSTSVPFIRSLRGYDRLSVEATPEDEGVLSSTFALRGLDSLLVAVQARCGWD